MKRSLETDFARRGRCAMAAAFLVGGLLASSARADLKFVTPANGTKAAVDSLHVFAVQANGKPATKGVYDYSLDGGKTWTPIVLTALEADRQGWKIPSQAGKTCLVRGRVEVAPGKSESGQISLEIIPSQEVKYEWKKITLTAPFAARDGAGALTYKGRMYFLGGWNPGIKKYFPRICNNEVWSSADGLNWRLDKPNTFLDRTFNPESDWEGRHTAGYVVYKDKMWIVGGDVNQGHYHNDVWNSTDGKKWTLVNKGKPVPWGPRALHYTLVHQDKIWVIGGQTVSQFAQAGEKFYRDCWTSTDGVNWEKITPQEPFWEMRGMIGGGTVFNGKIYMLGGGTYDTPKRGFRDFYDDVWSTKDGKTWTEELAHAPWAPRQYHDVAVFDSRMWVLEGYWLKRGNMKDVWYTADAINWYEVPNTPWAPRHAASVYVHDGGLWMVAGNNMQPDVWKLVRKDGKAAK